MKQSENEIMNDILDGETKNSPGVAEINSINKASTRNPECIN